MLLDKYLRCASYRRAQGSNRIGVARRPPMDEDSAEYVFVEAVASVHALDSHDRAEFCSDTDQVLLPAHDGVDILVGRR